MWIQSLPGGARSDGHHTPELSDLREQESEGTSTLEELHQEGQKI